MGEAEVGTCSACGQELILTDDDCWHPWSVENACPPERRVGGTGGVGGAVVIDWGDGFGRPGRDKFVSTPDVSEEADHG